MPALFRFALFFAHGSCKGLGAGKDDLAANERAVVLGIEPGHRRARIARQSSRSGLVTRRKDIACQRLLKVPLVRRVEGGKISGLPAVEGFGEGRIRFGTARSPTPISRKLASRSRQNASKSSWPRAGRAAPSLRPAAEPVQQQHQMQHNQVEPALDRIRNPVIGVKCHRTGLRHDGAIEGMDCTAWELRRNARKIIGIARISTCRPGAADCQFCVLRGTARDGRVQGGFEDVGQPRHA